MHKRQWSVTVLCPHVHHGTFSQGPEPKVLKAYLDGHFPGEEVHCAYEACKFGFWIQRELSTFDYDCIVVNPADIPTTNRQKNHRDCKVDSRKIADTLWAGLLKLELQPKVIQKG